MRGRRLEAISKRMNTIFWTKIDKDPDGAFPYLDRLIKIENTISPYVEQITGVKRLIKRAESKLENPVYT